MAIKDLLKTHRTWEDSAALFLGLVIGLAPWLARETADQFVVLNSAACGLAILMLAQVELVHFRRWEDFILLACGIWAFTSPFALSFADDGQLRVWHWGAGAMVMALALLEIWQDWRKPG